MAVGIEGLEERNLEGLIEGLSRSWQTQAKSYKEISMGAFSYEDLRNHLFAMADGHSSDPNGVGDGGI